MLLPLQTASAQGLLETIFGLLGGKPATSQSPSGAESGSSNPFAGRGGYSRSPQPSGGKYKTMCVRLCDGYYFPISHTSRRQEFYNDAEQCRSRCDSETRLYYTSPNSPTIDGARDLEGYSYNKLKTAFLYRKALQPGCSCRAKPWTASERLRHQRYALAEAGQLSSVAQVPAPIPAIAAEPKLIGEGREDAEADVVDGAPLTDEVEGVPAPHPAEKPLPGVSPGQLSTAPRPQRVRARPVDGAQTQWSLELVFGGGSTSTTRRRRWPGDTN